jgi:uncharacterized protein YndB with AHSA1/START domain
MPTEPQASMSTQVFEIYIKATPQAIWEAITSPEWNAKYGYQGPMHFELRAGGKFEARANAQMQSMGLPAVIIDGEVLESVPHRRLVHTYRWLFNEAHKKEGFTKVTYEIEQTPAGFSRLTASTPSPCNSAAKPAACRRRATSRATSRPVVSAFGDPV